MGIQNLWLPETSGMSQMMDQKNSAPGPQWSIRWQKQQWDLGLFIHRQKMRMSVQHVLKVKVYNIFSFLCCSNKTKLCYNLDMQTQLTHAVSFISKVLLPSPYWLLAHWMLDDGLILLCQYMPKSAWTL